ncbi:MAG: DUF6600 domain-containing protein [Hyphomicrobiaceae bacterium]|nr:DUF6600 domain-containing protein [Hyphomicrobiaceae bacterium]
MSWFRQVGRGSRILALLLAAVAAGVVATPGPVVAQDARESSAQRDGEDDISMDVIYEALDSHGRWFEHPEHGEVWAPEVEDDDWRPYTLGRWAKDDETGWTWVSEEPFGWVVYHFGRWGNDDEYGWFWVPGQEWAPAWVAWRESDDHIGWAPLPPVAAPRRDRDYSGPVYDRTDIYDEPDYEPLWVFSSFDNFLLPSVHRHIIPWHERRHRDVWRYSRPAASLVIVNRRYVNRGIDYDVIRRRSRRPVVLTRVVITNTYDQRRYSNSRGQGPRSIARVYRPTRGLRPQRQIRRDVVRRITREERRTVVTRRVERVQKKVGRAPFVRARRNADQRNAAPRRAVAPPPARIEPVGRPPAAGNRRFDDNAGGQGQQQFRPNRANPAERIQRARQIDDKVRKVKRTTVVTPDGTKATTVKRAVVAKPPVRAAVRQTVKPAAKPVPKVVRPANANGGGNAQGNQRVQRGQGGGQGNGQGQGQPRKAAKPKGEGEGQARGQRGQ